MKLKNLICAGIAAITLMSAATATSAASKKPTDPIGIISSQEFDTNWENLDVNTVWVEKAIGKIDNASGDGHNIADGLYICYKRDRYHGKKLKKGAKVISFFFYSPNHEDVEMRVDYYRGEIVLFSGYTS